MLVVLPCAFNKYPRFTAPSRRSDQEVAISRHYSINCFSLVGAEVWFGYCAPRRTGRHTLGLVVVSIHRPLTTENFSKPHVSNSSKMCVSIHWHEQQSGVILRYSLLYSNYFVAVEANIRRRRKIMNRRLVLQLENEATRWVRVLLFCRGNQRVFFSVIASVAIYPISSGSPTAIGNSNGNRPGSWHTSWSRNTLHRTLFHIEDSIVTSVPGLHSHIPSGKSQINNIYCLIQVNKKKSQKMTMDLPSRVHQLSWPESRLLGQKGMAQYWTLSSGCPGQVVDSLSCSCKGSCSHLQPHHTLPSRSTSNKSKCLLKHCRMKQYCWHSFIPKPLKFLMYKHSTPSRCRVSFHSIHKKQRTRVILRRIKYGYVPLNGIESLPARAFSKRRINSPEYGDFTLNMILF